MAIEADLIQRTLHLSDDDRAELARKLIVSLETESDPSDVNADQEWRTEVARRVIAYDRGETTSVDADEAIARIRASLSGGENRE